MKQLTKCMTFIVVVFIIALAISVAITIASSETAEVVDVNKIVYDNGITTFNQEL